MAFELSNPRVLLCGSRRWQWPRTVDAVLGRLAAQHGERLVVIEGAAKGADHAAHLWCDSMDCLKIVTNVTWWTGMPSGKPGRNCGGWLGRSATRAWCRTSRA